MTVESDLNDYSSADQSKNYGPPEATAKSELDKIVAVINELNAMRLVTKAGVFKIDNMFPSFVLGTSSFEGTPSSSSSRLKTEDRLSSVGTYVLLEYGLQLSWTGFSSLKN